MGGVSDGWVDRLQRVVREAGDRAVATFDSPFAFKSQETLYGLADYIVRIGRFDTRLVALHRISSSFGDSDDWNPGSDQSSVLSGAGYGPEGVEPDELLHELIAVGVQDLIDRSSRQRRGIGEDVNRARAEAQAEVATERAQLIEERDQARGDLDAATAKLAELQSHLDHAKLVNERLTSLANAKANQRPTGAQKTQKPRPKAATAKASK